MSKSKGERQVNPLEQNSKDKQERETSFAFTIGSSYISKALKYAKKQQPEKAQKYTNMFLKYIDEIINDISLAAVVPEERMLALIKIVNDERLQLFKQYLIAVENNDTITIESLVPIIKKMDKTLLLLIDCQEGKIEQPNLVTMPTELKRVIRNTDIPPNKFKFFFKSLNGKEHQNSKYNLKVTLPWKEDAPIVFTGLVPGLMNKEVMVDHASNPRNPAQAIKKMVDKKVLFQLYLVKHKLLRDEEVLTATYDLPLAPFRDHAQITGVFTMKNQIKGDNNFYSIDLIITSNTALVTPETDIYKFEIHCIPDNYEATEIIEQKEEPKKQPEPKAAPPKPAQNPTSPPQKPTPQSGTPAQQAKKPPQNTKPAQPPANEPKFYPMAEWERELFFSGNLIMQYKDRITKSKALFLSKRLPLPPELTAEDKMLDDKLNFIQEQIGEGKWTQDMYIEEVEKEVEKEQQMKSQLKPNDIKARILQIRINVMNSELFELKDVEDVEE